MTKACELCHKGPTAGRSYAHRGIAKYLGGIGIRTVRRNNRRFLPNLKRVRAIINGTTRRIRVCTSCLRSGRVKKAQ